MSLIIGLVGEKGSGKGTFIETLQAMAIRKIIRRVGSSDILGETLAIWDIPRNRRNLQDMAIVMDDHFGKGSLTHAVWKRMNETVADIIIFDGVRWHTDVDMIRKFPRHLLIYTTTSVEVRYERCKARKEKAGEAFTTYEKFMEEELVNTELEIPTIGAAADIKIENTGSLEEYKNTISKIYSDQILPKLSH